MHTCQRGKWVRCRKYWSKESSTQHEKKQDTENIRGRIPLMVNRCLRRHSHTQNSLMLQSHYRKEWLENMTHPKLLYELAVLLRLKRLFQRRGRGLRAPAVWTSVDESVCYWSAPSLPLNRVKLAVICKLFQISRLLQTCWCVQTQKL